MRIEVNFLNTGGETVAIDGNADTVSLSITKDGETTVVELDSAMFMKLQQAFGMVNNARQIARSA